MTASPGGRGRQELRGSLRIDCANLRDLKSRALPYTAFHQVGRRSSPRSRARPRIEEGVDRPAQSFTTQGKRVRRRNRTFHEHSAQARARANAPFRLRGRANRENQPSDSPANTQPKQPKRNQSAAPRTSLAGSRRQDSITALDDDGCRFSDERLVVVAANYLSNRTIVNQSWDEDDGEHPVTSRVKLPPRRSDGCASRDSHRGQRVSRRNSRDESRGGST